MASSLAISLIRSLASNLATCLPTTVALAEKSQFFLKMVLYYAFLGVSLRRFFSGKYVARFFYTQYVCIQFTFFETLQHTFTKGFTTIFSEFCLFAQEEKKRPVHWTWGGCGPGQLSLSGGRKHIERVQAHYTDKKENEIFPIYEEIQSGAVVKSYMREGFLIYEEMRKYFPIYMRRSLVIYEFATAPFWISLYMRKICFLFYQCTPGEKSPDMVPLPSVYCNRFGQINVSGLKKNIQV